MPIYILENILIIFIFDILKRQMKKPEIPPKVNDIKEISIVHLAAYIMYKKSLKLSSRII